MHDMKWIGPRGNKDSNSLLEAARSDSSNNKLDALALKRVGRRVGYSYI